MELILWKDFMFHYGQGKYVKEIIIMVRNYIKISPAKATLE
jgi:hypothetical protein